MSRPALPELAVAPEAFIAAVVKRIEAGRPARRAVPGGWLHMDRPLPFLCVYRHPPAEIVADAERLVLSQAAHLCVSADPALAPALRCLVGELGRTLSARFGSFLVLELWVAPGADTFRIHAPLRDPATTIAALSKALEAVDVLGTKARITTIDTDAPAPRDPRRCSQPQNNATPASCSWGSRSPGSSSARTGRRSRECCAGCNTT